MHPKFQPGDVDADNKHRFMPADALWTFAMSCNVWLSFFRSYDAAALRRLEWKYLLACYGVPFVPGLIYLFVNTIGRGKIYGSAVVCPICPYSKAIH